MTNTGHFVSDSPIIKGCHHNLLLLVPGFLLFFLLLLLNLILGLPSKSLPGSWWWRGFFLGLFLSLLLLVMLVDDLFLKLPGWVKVNVQPHKWKWINATTMLQVGTKGTKKPCWCVKPGHNARKCAICVDSLVDCSPSQHGHLSVDLGFHTNNWSGKPSVKLCLAFSSNFCTCSL